MKLTIKQEKFCQEIASGKNQSEAYRIAYESSLKWKGEAVWSQASQLMADSRVSVRVNEIRARNIARNEVKLDEVLENLAKFLRFNLKTIFKPDGTMKSFDEMTEEEAACIQSFEVVELFSGKGESKRSIGTVKKVKLIDKLGVVDKFLRQMGAYAKQPLIDENDIESLRDILKGVL